MWVFYFCLFLFHFVWFTSHFLCGLCITIVSLSFFCTFVCWHSLALFVGIFPLIFYPFFDNFLLNHICLSSFIFILILNIFPILIFILIQKAKDNKNAHKTIWLNWLNAVFWWRWLLWELDLNYNLIVICFLWTNIMKC